MKKLLILIGIILLASCSNEMVGDLEEQLSKCQPQEDIWTDGVIPYHFSDNIPEAEKQSILAAMHWYEENTVLDFVEYPEDEFFYLPNGVYIKYTGSVQSSYFPYGMGDYITDFRVGKNIHIEVALHELGHVIGLPHEHQRADRDESIIVHENNIEERWLKNYNISDIEFETPFDPTSIMIYPATGGAVDESKPTMEMIDGREIKPSKVPTQLDLEKIDELYCNELKTK